MIDCKFAGLVLLKDFVKARERKRTAEAQTTTNIISLRPPYVCIYIYIYRDRKATMQHPTASLHNYSIVDDTVKPRPLHHHPCKSRFHVLSRLFLHCCSNHNPRIPLYILIYPR